jgi:ribosomal protein S18 acetylase RimI-like enzyme
MNYIIRNASPSDISEIINLCAEHSEYEQAEYSRTGKAEKLAAYLFSPSSRLHCLIVESEGKIAGYASYFFDYSTWDADFFTYMDCLYLRPEYRGFGIGEALIKKIEAHSREQSIGQIQWHTPVFNTRAIKFYHRIGANSKDKIRFYYPVK